MDAVHRGNPGERGTTDGISSSTLGEQEPGEREWLVVGMCPAGGAGVRQINWTLIIGDINEVQDYCKESRLRRPW